MVKDQTSPVALWQALEQLQQWQRQNLPGTDSPQGRTLLVWLLRNDARPRPLGSLYRNCSSSESTMRAMTKLFVREGLAALMSNKRDIRRRMLCATPKLRQVIEEYGRQIERVAAAAD